MNTLSRLVLSLSVISLMTACAGEAVVHGNGNATGGSVTVTTEADINTCVNAPGSTSSGDCESGQKQE
jgi:hypothetical protein